MWCHMATMALRGFMPETTRQLLRAQRCFPDCMGGCVDNYPPQLQLAEKITQAGELTLD